MSLSVLARRQANHLDSVNIVRILGSKIMTLHTLGYLLDEYLNK